MATSVLLVFKIINQRLWDSVLSQLSQIACLFNQTHSVLVVTPIINLLNRVRYVRKHLTDAYNTIQIKCVGYVVILLKCYKTINALES